RAKDHINHLVGLVSDEIVQESFDREDETSVIVMDRMYTSAGCLTYGLSPPVSSRVANFIYNCGTDGREIESCGVHKYDGAFTRVYLSGNAHQACRCWKRRYTEKLGGLWYEELLSPPEGRLNSTDMNDGQQTWVQEEVSTARSPSYVRAGGGYVALDEMIKDKET
ncbi:hypothetical protein FOZ62_008572, partial [Perkinsus olseni]